jgi:IgGFc binding protein
MRKALAVSIALFPLSAIALVAACSSDGGGFGSTSGSTTTTLPTVTPTETATVPYIPPIGDLDASVDTGPPPTESRDPANCEEAKTFKSYVGCDYWPTVTPNGVWSVFDYAVVVSNVGKEEASVTVTGPSGTNKQLKVAPGSLEKVYLPWVAALKGPEADKCGGSPPLEKSDIVAGGAFHLVSSTPVIVYQFNALEYKGAGGPPGKNWSTCPGNKPNRNCRGGDPPCFSYSNDASLLLPSTAMTSNYRITGSAGGTRPGLIPILDPDTDVMGTAVTVTAIQDDTDVTLSATSRVKLLPGGGIPAKDGAGLVKFKLAKAGDVALLAGEKGEKFDFSGSLIQANKPIQVISAVPCANFPRDKEACDHVEESILPVETFGRSYVVTTPTKPTDGTGQHVVRFYGNQPNTKLTFKPSVPSGCPTTLNAGEVVTCGPVDKDFVVEGDKEFAVAGFMVGAQVYSPAGDDARGDPSQTVFASVEQFRKTYLFLAPDDYDVSYAVITGPADAAPKVDGVPVGGGKPLANGQNVWRLKLGAGKNGAHNLVAEKPVGLQVMGYGDNTSYQYPGGLDLKLIAAPPPPPN